jgi:hypothetical protein
MDDLLKLQKTLLASISTTVIKIKEPQTSLSKQSEWRCHYLFLMDQLLNVNKQMECVMRDMKKRVEDQLLFLNP